MALFFFFFFLHNSERYRLHSSKWCNRNLQISCLWCSVCFQQHCYSLPAHLSCWSFLVSIILEGTNATALDMLHLVTAQCSCKSALHTYPGDSRIREPLLPCNPQPEIATLPSGILEVFVQCTYSHWNRSRLFPLITLLWLWQQRLPVVDIKQFYFATLNRNQCRCNTHVLLRISCKCTFWCQVFVCTLHRFSNQKSCQNTFQTITACDPHLSSDQPKHSILTIKSIRVKLNQRRTLSSLKMLRWCSSNRHNRQLSTLKRSACQPQYLC